MSGPAVLEYALAVRSRYVAGGRSEKGRLLDEFYKTTEMHRKAAIRLLNRKAAPQVSHAAAESQHFAASPRLQSLEDLRLSLVDAVHFDRKDVDGIERLVVGLGTGVTRRGLDILTNDDDRKQYQLEKRLRQP